MHVGVAVPEDKELGLSSTPMYMPSSNIASPGRRGDGSRVRRETMASKAAWIQFNSIQFVPSKLRRRKAAKASDEATTPTGAVEPEQEEGRLKRGSNAV